MIGKWLASARRNKTSGGHIVHFVTPDQMTLCGRKLMHSREPTLNGEAWDINNTYTCKDCKGWYLLFFGKGADPSTIQDVSTTSNAPHEPH